MRSLAVGVACLLLLAAPAPAQQCRPETTALVLSGGGVKGLAHLGVLAALDSLGVRPDLIVGTSMGAIVGALYASGLSARQIDSLTRQLPLTEVVQPFRTAAPHPWDNRVPLVFMVRGRRGFAFQTGIVDETQPNALLAGALLRGNLVARGRFDDLPIRFRAVATDVRDRRTVVLAGGDLAQAVRASSAIPLVFPPVVIGESILVDGGLSANIPVAEARAAGATRIVVVDVTEHPRDTLDPESPLQLADQVLGFLFQQPGDSLRDQDIYIRPDIQRYRSLDFDPATIEAILRAGRQAADSALAGARCLPSGRAPSPATPAVFGGWSAPGAAGADSILLMRMLRLRAGSRLDLASLRSSLLGLAGLEAFRGIWLNPSGTGDTVRFTIEAVPAPTAVGGVGLAYDHERGALGWAGLFGRQLFGTTLEAGGIISLGRLERELFATALWHSDAGWSRITPLTSLRLRTEDVRRFDADGVELPPQSTQDARLSAGIDFRVRRDWMVRASADLLTWGADTVRGETSGGGSLRLARTTSRGFQLDSEILVASRFQSSRLEATWLADRGRWSFRPAIRAGAGHELPLQWTYPLGGDEGFPGLHIGEERGTRHLEGSLRVGFAVAGPLEARALFAAGRAWTPGVATDRDVLGGARLGIGADTPAGPIDVGYGLATDGRLAFYIRIGRWF